MNILGLDLSLNGPGFCYTPDRVTSMTMTSKDGPHRYVRIRDAIEYYLTAEIKRRPKARFTRGYSLAVIEAVPPYATSTASLERVHGVAQEVLARYGVPVAYISPTALKLYAAGDGKAEKQAMIDAVPRHVQIANDNEADAWWLADMGRAAGGDMELWRTLPDHRIAALSKVSGWPPDFSPADGHRATLGTKPQVVKCGHGYYCVVNAGRMLHPYLLDPCDKPAKPKSRAK